MSLLKLKSKTEPLYTPNKIINDDDVNHQPTEAIKKMINGKEYYFSSEQSAEEYIKKN